MNWVIYGAYGYTGRLLAEEAVRRGHRPILAGRSAERLAPLANTLGLEWQAVRLDDVEALNRLARRGELLFHAAGPYIETGEPVRSACLSSGINYVDITGELSVLEATLASDVQARQKGILLLSGAGFDVVPTDCLANHVARQVVDPVELQIAVASIGQPSSGTTQSAIEMIPGGSRIRLNGRLVKTPFGRGARQIRFSDRTRTVLPMPWGDLVTAYHSTGIPNITCYLTIPRRAVKWLGWFGPLGETLMKSGLVRQLARKWVSRTVQGPDEATRNSARSYVWACVRNQNGFQAEGWLETIEAYRFTAEAGVLAVEKILRERPVGALTPAQALGPEFVLQIKGTRILDQVPSGG